MTAHAQALSLRGYARRRGCSLKAVQRAIEAGRLKAAVVEVNGTPQIGDPALADREWAENTDESRRPVASDSKFSYWNGKRLEEKFRKLAAGLIPAVPMHAATRDAFAAVRARCSDIVDQLRGLRPDLAPAVFVTLRECIAETLEVLEDPAVDAVVVIRLDTVDVCVEASQDDTDHDGDALYWRTRTEQLQYWQAIGAVVDAQTVQAAIAERFSMVRNNLLGLPSRMKQRLPHLTLDDLATLEELVRENLEALARGEKTIREAP